MQEMKSFLVLSISVPLNECKSGLERSNWQCSVRHLLDHKLKSAYPCSHMPEVDARSLQPYNRREELSI